MKAGRRVAGGQVGLDAPGANRVPVLPPPAALLELVVLCGAIIVVDWLIPSIDVSELHPSPYWVPVLLLSLQYGAVSGMLAAVIASIATVYAGFPEQGVGENYFVYFMRVWALPIVWLGVAIVVGQFRTRQIALKQGLRRSLEDVSKQRAALAEHAQNLRGRCEALEREIAGREDRVSAPAFLDALARLGDGERALGDTFGAVMGAALPGAHVVLYMRERDGYVIAAETVPGAGLMPRRHLATTDALVAALSVSRVLSVLDADGEAILAGRGIGTIGIGLPGGATGMPGAGSSHAEPPMGMQAILLVVDAPGHLLSEDLMARLNVLGALVGQALAGRRAGPGERAPALPIQPLARPLRQRRWVPSRVVGSVGGLAASAEPARGGAGAPVAAGGVTRR